jgi:hypothetical protein
MAVLFTIQYNVSSRQKNATAKIFFSHEKLLKKADNGVTV